MVLVSSDVLQIEIENLLEVPWDVAILDTRWVVKGGTGRLANALMQTKCPHFVVACDLPASEIGLANTLRLIDSRHAVQPRWFNVPGGLRMPFWSCLDFGQCVEFFCVLGCQFDRV